MQQEEVFEFNDYGVCKNPRLAFHTFKNVIESLDLKIAAKDGKWGYAITIHCVDEGYGSSVREDKLNFETEDAAVAGAYKEVAEFMQKRRSEKKKNSTIFADFFKWYAERKQLSLF